MDPAVMGKIFVEEEAPAAVRPPHFPVSIWESLEAGDQLEVEDWYRESCHTQLELLWELLVEGADGPAVSRVMAANVVILGWLLKVAPYNTRAFKEAWEVNKIHLNVVVAQKKRLIEKLKQVAEHWRCPLSWHDKH